MLMSWVNGMSAEQRKEFVNDYKGSKVVRDRLTEILLKRKQEILNTQCKMEDFNNPNWQYKQAAYIGKMELIKEILELLK